MGQDISTTIEKVRQYLEDRSGPGPNEAETRHNVIAPIIESLGWEAIDTRHEYEIQIGTTSKRVDSALAIEERPNVFLEAKAATTDISDGDVSQLKSYMRQEWVRFGLLTNGVTFQLYYLIPSGEEPPNIVLLVDEELASFDDGPLPELLDRDHIASGHAEERAEDLLQIEMIRNWLQNHPERIESALRSVGCGDPDPDRFRERLFQDEDVSPHRYVVELSTDSGSVRIGGDSQSETMGKVAQYLDREHGLLERVELPFLGRSKSVPLLSEGRAKEWEKKEDEPGEYLSHQHIRGNVYIFTSLNSKGKQNKIQELCDICELTDPEFNDEWRG